MSTVRPATHDDVDALVAMGAQFYAYSTYSRFVVFDHDSVRANLVVAIDSPDGLALVAEDQGMLVGGIVGMAGPFLWFNKRVRCAVEMGWWVAESHRGGPAGARLFHAFEAWAAEQRADLKVYSDLVIDGEPPLDRMFARLGLTSVERAHIKGA